mmetsp:Transcript_24387/g.45801  ORF Transcript_24387/g.45801 Transcript_24387/m.45801 type:complete len:592 (-) Transcript_24387:153-1928(-)
MNVVLSNLLVIKARVIVLCFVSIDNAPLSRARSFRGAWISHSMEIGAKLVYDSFLVAVLILEVADLSLQVLDDLAFPVVGGRILLHLRLPLAALPELLLQLLHFALEHVHELVVVAGLAHEHLHPVPHLGVVLLQAPHPRLGALELPFHLLQVLLSFLIGLPQLFDTLLPHSVHLVQLLLGLEVHVVSEVVGGHPLLGSGSVTSPPASRRCLHHSASLVVRFHPLNLCLEHDYLLRPPLPPIIHYLRQFLARHALPPYLLQDLLLEHPVLLLHDLELMPHLLQVVAEFLRGVAVARAGGLQCLDPSDHRLHDRGPRLWRSQAVYLLLLLLELLVEHQNRLLRLLAQPLLLVELVGDVPDLLGHLDNLHVLHIPVDLLALFVHDVQELLSVDSGYGLKRIQHDAELLHLRLLLAQISLQGRVFCLQLLNHGPHLLSPVELAGELGPGGGTGLVRCPLRLALSHELVQLVVTAVAHVVSGSYVACSQILPEHFRNQPGLCLGLRLAVAHTIVKIRIVSVPSQVGVIPGRFDIIVSAQGQVESFCAHRRVFYAGRLQIQAGLPRKAARQRAILLRRHLGRRRHGFWKRPGALVV